MTTTTFKRSKYTSPVQRPPTDKIKPSNIPDFVRENFEELSNGWLRDPRATAVAMMKLYLNGEPPTDANEFTRQFIFEETINMF